MPDKRPSIRNAKQYEALKRKGMSKLRAARRSRTRLAPPGRGPEDGIRLGPKAQLLRQGPESVTPSPYGWPVIDRTRADRGGP